MNYVIEPWDNINLNLQSPHVVPVDPLSISLAFIGVVYPPLPWVTPSLSVEYVAPMAAASKAQSDHALDINRAHTSDFLAAFFWKSAVHASLDSTMFFGDAGHVDRLNVGAWASGIAAFSAQISNWSESSISDNSQLIAWGVAIGIDRGNYTSSWIMNTQERDAAQRVSWFSVNLTGMVYDDGGERLASLNFDTALNIRLESVSGVITGSDRDHLRLALGFSSPSRPSVPHDITRTLTARNAAPRDTSRLIPWGAGTSIWNNWNLPYPIDTGAPIPPDPIDPPARKIVYLIMNTLQITDVATGTPLDIQGVNISVDIDSLSWKFTGTVYGQGTLDLVRPDETGMKDIRVIINTHEWVFSIERYTSDEKFPTSKFSISGVSRTQYMAAPFAPVRSYTNSSATTAAQAANAELENTGFTLVWPTSGDGDLPDWIIPAGALSYREKTPAQVVAQIVTAAGGVMIPSLDDDSWIIQPRYKTSPWQWDTVTPDAAIYIGMVRSRSARYEPAPAYDSCFVSGVSQGVSVDVQRAGSGGLNPMPDVLDDLITAAAPAISRGRNELAATGNKVVETLSVLIPEQGAAPGVLRPGQIVSVTHDNPDSDYVGLVIANSISVQKAGGAEIYQSVTLERRA
jgi:hypothetical protein